MSVNVVAYGNTESRDHAVALVQTRGAYFGMLIDETADGKDYEIRFFTPNRVDVDSVKPVIDAYEDEIIDQVLMDLVMKGALAL